MDNLCTFKNCMLYSYITIIITIIFCLILNIYLYNKVKSYAKEKYNITHSILENENENKHLPIIKDKSIDYTIL